METEPARTSDVRASAAAFGAALVFHGAFSAALGSLRQEDGWFHARFSDLLRRGEAAWDASSFPWQTHSAWADFPMDWALGWHWLLAPFTAVADAATGARVFGVVALAALTATAHFAFRRLGSLPAWPWTCLLTVGCAGWLHREHTVRPTTLALALLVALLVAVLERRALVAGLLAVATMLLYHVPAGPLLVGGCGALGLLAADRRVPWRVGGAVVAGVAVAVLLHPGFWSVRDVGGASERATLHLWALQKDSLAFAADGGRVLFPGRGEIVVPLPSELTAPDAWSFLLDLRTPHLATLLAAFLFLRGGAAARRDGPRVATFVLALVAFAGTLRSGRFFEYWHPFAVLSAAVAVGRGTTWFSDGRRRTALLAVGALLIAGEVPTLRHVLADREDLGAEVRPALAAIRARAAPRDVVWHGSWDDFAPLFHEAPDLRYLTGFDAWYLVAKDREALLEHAAAQAGVLQGEALRKSVTGTFGARFVLLWKHRGRADRYAALEQELRRAPWAEVVHDGGTVTAFAVR